MQNQPNRTTVVIAMNAYRPGGSQTYAFTLAELLRDRGYSPLLVAKNGPWFEQAIRVTAARRAIWAEGTAAPHRNVLKRSLLSLAEVISAMRLCKEVRKASLIITSQPGPTAFFVRMRRRYWPNIPHFALVHGTTAVEWPFRDHDRTLDALTGLLAATPETSEFLRKQTDRTIEDIGNLFQASLFWGATSLPEVIASYDTQGPVVFLGTLTPNKTAPLAAILGAVTAVQRQLVIVGGGPLEPSIRRMVLERGLADSVSFTGSVSDPRPWIREASVVITAGRGALESMSGGRPTIIATSDGVHGPARLSSLVELQQYNFTGRTPTSEPPSIDMFTTHLQHALSMNNAERVEIAHRVQNIGNVDPITKLIDAD